MRRLHTVHVQLSEYPYETYDGLAMLSTDEATELRLWFEDEDRESDFLEASVTAAYEPTNGVNETIRDMEGVLSFSWAQSEDILKQHIPSITEEIESELIARCVAAAMDYEGNADVADVALRICHCGERIEDFYDYAMRHLPEVFEKAGYDR